MQSCIKNTHAGCVIEREGGRRYVRIATEPKANTSINIPTGESQSLWPIMKNEKGLIVVKAKSGVYYIRHDIIFAKAGDVFFMPRKVPADFKIEEETVLTREELEQFEAMSEKF